MALQVISLGYERRTIEEFVSILQKQKVTKLIDIRELPLSRKKGFSKKLLSAYLEKEGIRYIHLKEAGNPYRKLRTDVKQCLELYKSYLLDHSNIVETVRFEIENSLIALMCYERNYHACHRSVLIELICQQNATIEVIKI